MILNFPRQFEVHFDETQKRRTCEQESLFEFSHQISPGGAYPGRCDQFPVQTADQVIVKCQNIPQTGHLLKECVKPLACSVRFFYFTPKYPTKNHE